ncbi:MAG: triose-phosphate isomerase [Firmicutes bacterium]|nr:triose-phosphate isomerase [Bacillota bacterium]
MENKRKPLLMANWKMNKTAERALSWLTSYLLLTEGRSQVGDVVVCPPFTALYAMHQRLAEAENINLALGAQDIFWMESGAYTGEIAAEMLTECGVEYVICGHSERRQLLQESSEMISKKCGAAVSAGMTPVLCVGESLSIREGGLTMEWLEAQLNESLRFWDKKSDIVIAYEPIWAIGTGRAASAADAQSACLCIRNFLREIAGDVADTIRILYGGSVTPDNVDELMTEPDVDGALVGGASLQAEIFAEIALTDR